MRILRKNIDQTQRDIYNAYQLHELRRRSLPDADVKKKLTALYAHKPKLVIDYITEIYFKYAEITK